MYQNYPGLNPFASNMQNYQNTQQQTIIRVNGENGAKAFQMAGPNSSVLLLDETEPVIWVKITDGAGYPTLTKYRIEECKPEKSPEIKTLEERISRLEELINGKSYTEYAEQEK